MKWSQGIDLSGNNLTRSNEIGDNTIIDIKITLVRTKIAQVVAFR
ncbi:MAG: hypothetical protein WC590_10355 [Burkholderiaceae bacterium]